MYIAKTKLKLDPNNVWDEKSAAHTRLPGEPVPEAERDTWIADPNIQCKLIDSNSSAAQDAIAQYEKRSGLRHETLLVKPERKIKEEKQKVFSEEQENRIREIIEEVVLKLSDSEPEQNEDEEVFTYTASQISAIAKSLGIEIPDNANDDQAYQLVTESVDFKTLPDDELEDIIKLKPEDE